MRSSLEPSVLSVKFKSVEGTAAVPDAIVAWAECRGKINRGMQVNEMRGLTPPPPRKLVQTPIQNLSICTHRTEIADYLYVKRRAGPEPKFFCAGSNL